jgi:hypothetical protein
MTRQRYLLRRDGKIWIAAAPGFLDPSEGPVGRGETPEEAIEDLGRQPEFQAWLRENQFETPTVRDFAIETGDDTADLTFVDANGKRHITNPSTT